MEQQQGSPFPFLIMVLIFVVIGFWPGYIISKKAGFDWRMAVCLALPGFNIIAWFALAFMEWPIHKYLPEHVKSKCLNKPTSAGFLNILISILKEINMKNVFVAAFLIFISASCLASDEKGKYEQGDCIMASDTGYSWFGEFAKVEAYSRIKGFAGPQYILFFPSYKADAVVFDPEIEEHTIKVGNNFCQR